MGRCSNGYLEISDGSSSQRYCGTSTPAPLTTTNTITVKVQLEGPQGGVREISLEGNLLVEDKKMCMVQI